MTAWRGGRWATVAPAVALVLGCSSTSTTVDAGARDSAIADTPADLTTDLATPHDGFAPDAGDVPELGPDGGRDGGPHDGDPGDVRDGSLKPPVDPSFCWRRVPAPANVLNLAVSGPDDVWMMTSAAVHHWDGKTTSALPPHGISAAHSWVAGPNDVWVAGNGLKRWMGTNWITFSTANISDITGRGPDDAWWATADGHVFHWDGANPRDTSLSANPISAGNTSSILWEVAADDVWHFGADPSRTGTSQIAHYDGSKWTVVSDPTSPMMKDRSFISAWGSGSKDIWVGVLKLVARPNSALTASGELWHYDGASWSISATPAASPSLTRVRSLWGTGPSDVWAAVGTHHLPLSQLWHWNGTQWTAIDTDALYVSQVAGVSAKDWWAYGIDAPALGPPTGPALFHVDGRCDTGAADGGAGDAAAPSGGFEWTQDIEYDGTRAAWVFSPDDVWRAASNGVDRWDGTTWANVLSTDPYVPTGERPAKLWASGPTNLWAAGATIQQWDGRAWTDRSITTAARPNSKSLWGAAADDVWTVVYQNGAPLLGTSPWHWNGQAWTEATVPASAQGMVQAVWGASSRDVWAVGRGSQVAPSAGLFLHWDGTSWSQVPGDSTVALTSLSATGLWGSGANDVWAIGTGFEGAMQRTVIWHYDGKAWKRAQAAPAASCVFGNGPSNVWFCGEGAQLHHFDGNAFSTIDIGVSSVTLAGGAVAGADELWAWGSYPGSAEVLFHGRLRK